MDASGVCLDGRRVARSKHANRPGQAGRCVESSYSRLLSCASL